MHLIKSRALHQNKASILKVLITSKTRSKLPKILLVSGQTINRPKNAKKSTQYKCTCTKTRNLQQNMDIIFLVFFFDRRSRKAKKNKSRFWCHSKSYMDLSTSSLLDHLCTRKKLSSTIFITFLPPLFYRLTLHLQNSV